MMKNIYILLRITAIILVVIMPLMVFSGFFMTKSFLVPWVDYSVAARMHGFFLLIILLPVLYLHSLAGILIAMQRRASINNKVTRTLVVIFWTIMLIAMGYFFLAQAPSTATAPQGSSTATPSSDTVTGSSSDAPAVEPSALAEYTLEEIAAHSTPDDCWLLIDGKVYDATSAIVPHPGGQKNIIDNCGKEATEAFNTKNKGVPHSPTAQEMLKNLLIGRLSP